MASLSEVLTAYRIYAQADGRSPKLIYLVMSSMACFCEFLGPERQDIERYYPAVTRVSRHHQ